MSEKQYIKGFVDKVKEEIISATATTDTKDREGESVKITGWKLDNFKANPVLLWSHNPNEPAIGKVTDIWHEGNKLKFNAKFAEKDTFAQRIKNLVQQGILSTVSVGFQSKEQDDDGNSTEQELLEISFVNVPCNPEARMASAYKSLVKDFPKRVPEKKKEVKEEKKKEEPKEKDEMKERFIMAEGPKNKLRILVSACEGVIDESKKILKTAESPKKQKAEIKKPVKSKENPRLKWLKRIDKEVEEEIREENKN